MFVCWGGGGGGGGDVGVHTHPYYDGASQSCLLLVIILLVGSWVGSTFYTYIHALSSCIMSTMYEVSTHCLRLLTLSHTLTLSVYR